jgi:di/tricarboxylate transporter
MGPEWIAIIALVALFVVGTVLPINMGALAYVAAWLVGMYSLGLDEKEILAGISADLVLTLIGVTYLFAIARQNGTVDLIVRTAVSSVGGRVALIPWVMFAVTAVITAIGAASPAACAIIGPIALGFAGRYGISPLMMGMFVVHGAQAGGFSPISIYGTITNSVMEDAGLGTTPLTIFFSSLVVNTIMAAILFVALGGRQLMKLRMDDDGELVEAGATSGATSGGASGAPTGTGGASGGGGTATRVHPDRSDARSATGATPTTGTPNAEDTGTTLEHTLTLLAFLAVAVVALVFDKNIGFAAITAAVVLSILTPKAYKDTVKQIAWPTVLLVAGVSTYATILTTAGSPEFVGKWAAGLGAVVIGALILCYVGGIVSAFASSTALLPVIIPIAIPLVAEGGLSAGFFVAALAVSSTIVDVSPFSTNGALMLANRPHTIDENTYYNQILGYATIVTLVGPLLVWAALVLPGW